MQERIMTVFPSFDVIFSTTQKSTWMWEKYIRCGGSCDECIALLFCRNKERWRNERSNASDIIVGDASTIYILSVKLTVKIIQMCIRDGIRHKKVATFFLLLSQSYLFLKKQNKNKCKLWETPGPVNTEDLKYSYVGISINFSSSAKLNS